MGNKLLFAVSRFCGHQARRVSTFPMFRDVTVCSPTDAHWGLDIADGNQTSNTQTAASQPRVCSLGLLLYLEDGGCMLDRNVSGHLSVCIKSRSKRWPLLTVGYTGSSNAPCHSKSESHSRLSWRMVSSQWSRGV
jgi:hypothetical protein